ncbi:MAG: FAD-dependent oxidoreductase [Thermoguttaceae bacterium]|nr:FAD-dependent oxidoreductase [Thermoguttaceae bacterium]
MRVIQLSFCAVCLAVLGSTALWGAGEGRFSPRTTVWIEAESMADSPETPMAGGWTVDPQLIDTVGSSVLLAHGLGKPVADASGTFNIPQSGDYRLFVRTRNWVAPWSKSEAPGRFRLLIDGNQDAAEFGTEGEKWHWQPGGTVRLEAGEHTIALRDLTGFDGRCDAICLSSDPNFVPPEEDEALKAFRAEALGWQPVPADVRDKPFDLVVVGGGMAGICAAVSAARLGLDVALVQNRFTLGGNNSSDVRVHLQGKINLDPYPNIGNLVYELQHDRDGNAEQASNYEDEKKFAVVRAEKNLTLFLATHVDGVEMDGQKIAAVYARGLITNERIRLAAPLFADCTGDGNLGFLAGADWRYGRESQEQTGEPDAPKVPDKMTMGASVQWYAVDAGRETSFPELPWAIQFSEESIRPMVHGDWDWETGLNWDQITEIEKIRDHGLRAAYGHWAYMKNHASGQWAEKVKNMELGWVSSYAGKRESRRLMGDIIIDEVDVCGGRTWPDASVTATWGIDLHYPEKENSKFFPGEEFRTICEVRGHHSYAIPYRCFYSRNISNLFMAGRDISVTHAALGTIRVMRTGGMMGEVVGMAASVCKAHDAEPRDVYQRYFGELQELMTRGVGAIPPGSDTLGKPAWLDDRENLAPRAAVCASSEHESGQYPAKNVNDGQINPPENPGRYVSANGSTHWVQFDFAEPVTLSALRFVVGPVENRRVRYQLEYLKDGDWVCIPETVIKNRFCLDFAISFPQTTASSFRLVQVIGEGDSSGLFRLWEVELY